MQHKETSVHQNEFLGSFYCLEFVQILHFLIIEVKIISQTSSCIRSGLRRIRL